MEATLMYLTDNDSRLAEDLISALSALFISFFSAEMEDENETESINVHQCYANFNSSMLPVPSYTEYSGATFFGACSLPIYITLSRLTFMLPVQIFRESIEHTSGSAELPLIHG